MNATEIVRQLAATERMPVEAIEAARADRAALVPEFVRGVEKIVAGEGESESDNALFWIFHLLGEWREKTAYRPLAALLRLPGYEIEEILGDATADTSHRVMAAVFDGDPTPLYDIIRDPDADEFVRSRMCEALAMVTLRGELPREQTVQFLRACFSELEQENSFVWEGWQNAIAMLGLVELVPLVKQAFEREFVDPQWLGFADFEKDLHEAVSGAGPLALGADREFELFGDTVEELSTWAFSEPESETLEDSGFEPEPWERRERRGRGGDDRVVWSSRDGPAVNPYKGVGRNDPCPCGSGKKFKKCCLGKIDAPRRAAPWAPEPRFGADADFDDGLSDDGVFSDHQTEYDPLIAPDPQQWLAMDEDERIGLVMDFHREARISLPNENVHAVLHVTVENQIAEGDALPVRRTVNRLMAEGLDRHDAIHAIGMVLIGHLNDLMKQGRVEGDPTLPYFVELERLTAEEWRRSG